jgi:hypothetical protein
LGSKTGPPEYPLLKKVVLGKYAKFCGPIFWFYGKIESTDKVEDSDIVEVD